MGLGLEKAFALERVKGDLVQVRIQAEGEERLNSIRNRESPAQISRPFVHGDVFTGRRRLQEPRNYFNQNRAWLVLDELILQGDRRELREVEGGLETPAKVKH